MGANESSTDYWAALEAEKASSTPNKQWLWSTTPFETAAAAPPPPPPPSAQQSSSNPPSASHTPSNGSPFSSAPGSRSATPTNNSRSDASLAKRWLDSPEVRMPTHLRDLVESTIRGQMTQFPSAASTLADSFSDHLAVSDLPSAPTPEDEAITRELISTGFRKGHVLNALSYVHSSRSSSAAGNSDALLRSFASQPLRLAVISYLHLHTPEEDLPAAFRSSKPPDAAARLATSLDSDELAQSWKADILSKETGMPREVVGVAIADAGGEQGVAVDLMVRRLVGWTEEESPEAGLSDAALLETLKVDDSADKAELEQRRKDEIEGLEGIFGDRFRRTETGIEILASTLKRKPGVASDQIILRILFHPRSTYPSPASEDPSTPPFAHLPTFYVYSSTLPAYIRLQLTSLIAQQFVSPDHPDWLDSVHAGYGGVVCEMANFLMEVHQGVIDSPPDAREVLAHFAPKRQVAVAVAGKKSNGAGGRRGGRRGGRVGRPPATPGAHAALKRHLEENARMKGYETMLKVREALPAWSMKEEIVDLIDKNRVVIVSGETGSGKTTQGGFFLPPAAW